MFVQRVHVKNMCILLDMSLRRCGAMTTLAAAAKPRPQAMIIMYRKYATFNDIFFDNDNVFIFI